MVLVEVIDVELDLRDMLQNKVKKFKCSDSYAVLEPLLQRYSSTNIEGRELHWFCSIARLWNEISKPDNFGLREK